MLESWRRRKPEIIGGIFCLLVAVALVRVLVRRQLYIETQNATLQGYSIALSSEVDEEVREVYVDENQVVRKGQLLCRLEDSREKARLEAASGKMGALRARYETARRDEQRSNYLLKRQAVSVAAHDRAVAQADSLFRQVKAAEADLAEAETNLARTHLTAPDDGVIAFRSARPGMLARKGVPLFGFVAGSERWVLARIRETDLSDLHVGKQVQVRFDLTGSREFDGRIESIAPTTEKQFYSAIPPDFSAGNYTKYVQWQPVRIRLALSSQDGARLPVGISSTVHMRRD